VEGKRLLIASGKGGAGKSTLCVLLGSKLYAKGKSVVLLDLDFGIRALDLFMGVENAPYHLSDVLERACRPADALVSLKEDHRFVLCPAPPSRNDSSAIRWDLLKPLVTLLSEHFDYVLLDCPAGVTPALYAASRVCDEALIVTNPEPVAVRSAALCRALVASQNSELKQYLLINRAMPRISDNMITDFDSIMDETGLPLLGVVPFDATLSRLAADGRLTEAKGEPLQSVLERIVLRLEGKNAPLILD